MIRSAESESEILARKKRLAQANGEEVSDEEAASSKKGHKKSNKSSSSSSKPKPPKKTAKTVEKEREKLRQESARLTRDHYEVRLPAAVPVKKSIKDLDSILNKRLTNSKQTMASFLSHIAPSVLALKPKLTASEQCNYLTDAHSLSSSD